MGGRIKIWTWTLCILWMVFFISTQFINDYHYTKYTNVKIINNKELNTRNLNCENSSHDHYYHKIAKITFTGKNSKGESVKFETSINKKDSDYKDIVNGKYKVWNRGKSLISWAPLIFFFVFSIVFLICQYEDEGYVYKEEAEDKIDFWVYVKTFLGGDPEIIKEIADEEREHIRMKYYGSSVKAPSIIAMNKKYNEIAYGRRV